MLNSTISLLCCVLALQSSIAIQINSIILSVRVSELGSEVQSTHRSYQHKTWSDPRIGNLAFKPLHYCLYCSKLFICFIFLCLIDKQHFNKLCYNEALLYSNPSSAILLNNKKIHLPIKANFPLSQMRFLITNVSARSRYTLFQ